MNKAAYRVHCVSGGLIFIFQRRLFLNIYFLIVFLEKNPPIVCKLLGIIDVNLNLSWVLDESLNYSWILDKSLNYSRSQKISTFLVFNN